MQYQQASPRPITATRTKSDQGGGQKDDFIPNMSVRSPRDGRAGKPNMGAEGFCSCINFGGVVWKLLQKNQRGRGEREE